METVIQPIGSPSPGGVQAPAEPCVLVIFGASGDLTKRLLMPALYNLACDGLLPDRFCIVGLAMDDLSTEAFRERIARRTSSNSARARKWIRKPGSGSVLQP